jgi:hypothetical protein
MIPFTSPLHFLLQYTSLYFFAVIYPFCSLECWECMFVVITFTHKWFGMVDICLYIAVWSNGEASSIIIPVIHTACVCCISVAALSGLWTKVLAPFLLYESVGLPAYITWPLTHPSHFDPEDGSSTFSKKFTAPLSYLIDGMNGRPLLFWDIIQHWLVVGYWHCWTACWSHLQGSLTV